MAFSYAGRMDLNLAIVVRKVRQWARGFSMGVRSKQEAVR